MSSAKSNLARILRTKSPASHLRLSNISIRELARTAQNASKVQDSIQNTDLPAPFFPSGHQSWQGKTFQPIPAQHPASNQFSQLVDDITTSLTTISSKPNLQHLTRILRSYKSHESQWERYAFADPEMQYTRNLVAEVPGIFTLLLLVWTSGKKSPVHDHADAHCLMKVLQGEIRERRYAIPTDPTHEGFLTQTSDLTFKLNQVTYMADVLGLHEIANPSKDKFAMSLHLYTPPNAAMRGCHVYDKQNGERKHVMQGAWHSVAGILNGHE